MLDHPVRLIHKDHRRLLREQVQEVLRPGVKIVNVSLKRSEPVPFLRVLLHLRHRRFQPVRLFRAAPVPVGLLDLLRLFPDPFKSVIEPRVREDHLCRGIDPHEFQLHKGPLAEHVKRPDRFHFVSPQLDSVGVLLRQLIDIENIAPDRELSRLFHLILLLIAHSHQPFRRFRK